MNRRELDRSSSDGINATPIRPLAVWPILVAWILVFGWWISPLVSGVGGRWQYVVWLPDWVWLVLVGFCSALALLMVTTGHRPRSRGLAFAAVLAVLGPLWGTLHRDVGLSGQPALGDATVLFLNPQDPGEQIVEALVDELVAMDADVAVIVNPGWIPVTWRAVESAQPTGRFFRNIGGVFVVSRTAIHSMRRIVARGEIQAMEITLGMKVGSLLPRKIVVADLPSDLTVNRAESLRMLAAGIAADVGSDAESSSPIDLLLGDLNTTPRSPGLEQIIPGFVDAFTSVGRGWGGTWPRDRGWLRIDFALAPLDRMPESVVTFDPGTGGHRGLVVGYRRP